MTAIIERYVPSSQTQESDVMLKFSSISLVFGSVIAGAASGYAAIDSSLATNMLPALHATNASFSQPVDPMITGNVVTDDHMKRWLKRRAKSNSCNDCAASQPFPDDE